MGVAVVVIELRDRVFHLFEEIEVVLQKLQRRFVFEPRDLFIHILLELSQDIDVTDRFDILVLSQQIQVEGQSFLLFRFLLVDFVFHLSLGDDQHIGIPELLFGKYRQKSDTFLMKNEQPRILLEKGFAPLIEKYEGGEEKIEFDLLEFLFEPLHLDEGGVGEPLVVDAQRVDQRGIDPEPLKGRFVAKRQRALIDRIEHRRHVGLRIGPADLPVPFDQIGSLFGREGAALLYIDFAPFDITERSLYSVLVQIEKEGRFRPEIALQFPHTLPFMDLSPNILNYFCLNNDV